MPQNTHGTEIWIAREVSTNCKLISCISIHEVCVIHATPTILAVKVHTKDLHLNLVSGHAPHSAHTSSDQCTWWEELDKVCDQLSASGGEMIIMIDANSHFAAEIPGITGCAMSYRANEPAEYFQALLEHQELTLPGTFFRANPEPRLATSYVNGSGVVNDYISVHMQHLDKCVDAGRLLEFDMSLSSLDHVCVYLDMDFAKISSRSEGWRRPKICNPSQLLDTHVLQSIAQALEQAPHVPWEVDVHSHCQVVEEFVQNTVQELMIEQNVPKKSHVSQESLAITRIKSSWLRTMQHSVRQILWWCRYLVFSIWASVVAALRPRRASMGCDSCERWTPEQTIEYALSYIRWHRCTKWIAEHQRSQYHVLLKRKLRSDRMDYINKTIAQTEQAIERGDTREAFARLKQLRRRTQRSLPMLKGGDGRVFGSLAFLLKLRAKLFVNECGTVVGRLLVGG